jgi:hypothetical protein
MRRIPVTFEYPVLALPTGKAAKAMGIDRKTLWKLKNRTENPIRETAYGVIPIAEIQRHLREEIAR